MQTRLHQHNGIMGEGVKFERSRRVTGYAGANVNGVRPLCNLAGLCVG